MLKSKVLGCDIWVITLFKCVFQYRLEPFDDATLLVNNCFLSLDMLLQELVVLGKLADLLRQPLVILLQASKQRVHLLNLGQTGLPTAPLLQLCILLLECLHALLEEISVFAHFLNLVFIQTDFMLVVGAFVFHQCINLRLGGLAGLMSTSSPGMA